MSRGIAMTAPTTWKAIVTIAIATALAVGAQEKRIVPKIITGYGTADEECPPVELIDSAIQDIRNVAMAIIDSNGSVQGVPECGAGLWHHVAHLNMSDPSQQCPSAWREYNISSNAEIRACGRPSSSEYCPSKTYPVTHQYSRVCGRVIGYQFKSLDAFYRHCSGGMIDEPYVDGVSVTYGTPRKHIWTYAASWHEGHNASQLSTDIKKILCPCRYSGQW